MEKTDLLLSLLYAKGATGKYQEPIIGITRLTKLLFLLKEEAGINDAFTFEPYKMGPFSNEVYSEIDFLENFPTPEKALLLVKNKNGSEMLNPEQLKYLDDMDSRDEQPLERDDNNSCYNLSETGKKVAKEIWESLPRDKQLEIEEIKSKFGSLPLRSLLKYVYDKHTEMTINSEIIDQIYDS